MKTAKSIALILFSLFTLFSCDKPEKGTTTKVLVSVAPHKYLIERIAGTHLDIHVVVPPGASPHDFDPRPKDVDALYHATLWFTNGESFEKRLSKSLKENNPKLRFIDMRDGLPLIACTHEHAGTHIHHNHSDLDNHTWFSPKMLILQAKHILHVLEEEYPEYKDEFEANTIQLIADLNTLNTEILEQHKQHPEVNALLASHQAFAYFCRDYDLEPLAVEYEGRDPLPQQIEALIKQANVAGLSCVLLQAQYNNKGAILIAKTLELPTFEVDPYAENCITTLRTISKHVFSTSH